MKSNWQVVALGHVATLQRDIVDPKKIVRGTAYVGLENIESGGRIINVRGVDSGELASSKFSFSPQHVLYGKLRPYLAKIARPDFEGICSTDILPILPGPLMDRDYLMHYLRQPDVVDLANSRSTGANLPRLSPKVLAEFEIPLPPLPEQKRIAAILDAAEALREKRRQAIAKASELVESLFRHTFGDLASNSHGYSLVRFVDLLELPLRNGLSPSESGSIAGQVLTLSAITQGGFNPEAVKSALFSDGLRNDRTVDRRDFLICRGNGNKRLVGTGHFPSIDMPSVLFPDTIIAARINHQIVAPGYLEAIWSTSTIRDQIERAARTTNGTFKINQTNLEGLIIPTPPIVKQEQFGLAALTAYKMRDASIVALQQLDSLFHSLQHRVFRGEL